MSNTLPIEHAVVLGNLPSETFYKTKQWRDARITAFNTYGSKCQLCGKTPRNGVFLHVDHIKPRSIYPEFCLDISNLQVLCEDCHIAKGLGTNNYHKGIDEEHPKDIREFLRIRKKHLILGWRNPSSRAERDNLSNDIVARSKNIKKRWRLLVVFCFTEKISYTEAVQLTIEDFRGFNCSRNERFNRFFWWGGNGPKSEKDLAFDIGGCVFPEQISMLLADEDK